MKRDVPGAPFLPVSGSISGAGTLPVELNSDFPQFQYSTQSMMERWPKDFLRLNLNANRSGNVALRSWLYYREQPSFVLNGCSQTQNLRGPVITSRADIGQSAASRNKLLTDLLMAKIDLQAIPCVKPVVGPSLCSLAFAADPASLIIALGLCNLP